MNNNIKTERTDTEFDLLIAVCIANRILPKQLAEIITDENLCTKYLVQINKELLRLLENKKDLK